MDDMAGVMKVLCGACNHKLRLPYMPGKKALCSRCEATLVIPTLDQVARVKPERFVVKPVKPPKKKVEKLPPPKKKSGRITQQVLKDMLQSDPEAPALDDLCGDGPDVEF